MAPNHTEKAPIARRWRFPPRSLSQWMTVVALSGLAMAALAPRGGVAPAPPLRFAPARNWALTAPRPEPAPLPWAPDRRFVVAAPEGLDPRFVVAAPRGIDDRIVANPDGPAVRYEPLPGTPGVLMGPDPDPPAALWAP